MEFKMIAYLNGAETDQDKRHIIIAFGFPEDEVDEVFEKYNKLK